MMPQGGGGTSGWSNLEAFANTESGQKQIAQSQAPKGFDTGGFWGSGFGKGLGYIINNPVTRAVTAPLNYLQTGGRAATLGVEELAEALPGTPKWAQALVGSIPGLGTGTMGPAPGGGGLLGNVDTARTEADTRSNWSKVFAPNTTYGYGELLAPTLPKWASGPMGLAGDVALDPLTYIGGGASRVAAGVSHVDEAARMLDQATTVLRAAEEAGDASKIAKAAQRVAQAEEYVARAPTLPGGGERLWELPLPRNRAERANLLGELSATPEGRQFLAMPGEAARAGERGFQVISPEAKELLRIQEPGLRFRGMPQKIPFTGGIIGAEGLNRLGGAARAGVSRLPGATAAAGNIRTPKGLEEAYNVLTRGAEGDILMAGTDVWLRNQIRRGSGEQLARGNRILSNSVKEFFKGKSKTAIRQMVREAETAAEPNDVNKIGARLLELFQKVTGREIDPAYLRNPNTYFPHLLDPKARRYLMRLKKQGSKAADDFMRHAGLVEDDLLEDPRFYNDNILEGSGFLEKARSYGTDKNGAPRTFDIGGTEVTFEADDVDHINEQLRKAFPNFKGDFYDTDPVRVFEAYNKSLSRQAGRDLASRELVKSGNPLAAQLVGDLDATRIAMNEALAQQGHAGLLATAQGRYDPTQPLPKIAEAPPVPGQAVDRGRRAQIEEVERALAEATSPEERMARTEELAAIGPAAERIGEVNPADYFRTTEGKVATQALEAQAKRAKTYATAAAAEAIQAEEKLRQGIYDLREVVITPLRTTVDETKKEISALNKKMKTWAKTIKDMGDLNVNNQDEMTALLANIESAVTNAETKLKRTASSWKGRATRKQRQVEAQLRGELENLTKLRDEARAKARAAPREIAEEIELRERILNQPVREANEALLRAEMEFARGRPVPHNQATIDGAMDALEQQLANTDTDPGELLERFRGVIEDLRQGSRVIRDAGELDTPEAAHARQVYAAVLEEIEELGSRRRRGGRLSKANQALMDDAILRRNQLRLALGQGVTPGGGPLKMNPFDEAQAALADARAAVRRAESAGEAPEVTPELVEALLRNEISLADLGKGEGVGDLPRLRAERDRLARQFRPGGRFYKEQQARDILKDAADYDSEMEQFTAGQRKALEQAMFQRERTQESIIWKRRREAPPELSVVEPTPGEKLGALPKISRPQGDRTGNRYIAPFGTRQSALEEMGRGVGEQRIVEPVPMRPGEAPQPEAWAIDQPQPVFNQQTGLWERRAIPPPRSEAEAITSLKSLQQTGGPEAMAARGQARVLGEQVTEQSRTLPQRIGREQARIQMEMAARADQELGPLAQRVQTYKNLADDVNNKQNLVVKRDEAAALRDRLKPNPKNQRTDIGRTLDEIEAVAKANPYLEDAQLTQVESLLQSHRAEAERIDEVRMRVDDLDRVVDDAKNGRLGKVMIATLNNNWRALHNGPLNTGDIIMDAELHRRFTNLFELSRQPKLLGRTFNAFTNLFKTYATLTPGFFVRNTIGGVFMNTADGVSLRAQAEGAEKWQQYMKGGEEWLAEQPPRVQDAFSAAFASGAGGRFEESGVLAKTESALYNFLSSNRATRWGQRMGTRVEGGMRLGMALDSIDNGMGVQGALQRITRVHFDYAQVSQLDETMKRIIPFWTFMSRNLPLQIQEQWTNPRVYSYYDHLVQNFSLPDEEFTPDYWSRQGAWRTPVSIGGNSLYMQPDLGFTRVQSDMKLLSDALSGENFGGLFAQANPAIGATLDFMNKRDSFYNRSFDPNTDYTKQTGILGAPVTALAKALGQTNEMGQVSDNFLNYLQSMIPPLSQATRLFPGATGKESSPQTWAKRARYAGFPIQLLTPDAQESEYWRQWRAMQDEADAQRAMIREAAS